MPDPETASGQIKNLLLTTALSCRDGDIGVGITVVTRILENQELMKDFFREQGLSIPEMVEFVNVLSALKGNFESVMASGTLTLNSLASNIESTRRK